MEGNLQESVKPRNSGKIWVTKLFAISGFYYITKNWESMKNQGSYVIWREIVRRVNDDISSWITITQLSKNICIVQSNTQKIVGYQGIMALYPFWTVQITKYRTIYCTVPLHKKEKIWRLLWEIGHFEIHTHLTSSLLTCLTVLVPSLLQPMPSTV